MFGRRPAKRQDGHQLPTVHTVLVPVADPDTAAITRERALRHQTGRMLQGVAGYVIDYDRGHPEHSSTRVAHHAALPTDAYARIGMRDGALLEPAQIYDTGTTDARLSAYQIALLARINDR